MQHNPRNKILALLLTVAMVFTIMPLTAFAEGESAPLGYFVAALDALPDETLWQGYDLGAVTSPDELTLPSTLTGTDSDDNPVTIDGVTWQSKPAFDPAVSAWYTFSPTLSEGTILAEGVTAPVISVFIRPEGGVQIQPMSANITWDGTQGTPPGTPPGTDMYGNPALIPAAPNYSGNTVTVTGDVLGFVYGGGVYDDSSGSALSSGNNSVSISNSATIQNDVYGGYARSDSGGTATANNNSVSVSDYAAVGNDVIGGFARSDSGAAAANNNSVSVSNNAAVTQLVIGGIADSASDTATATGSNVTISDSHADGVRGGFASTSGIATATYNTVTLFGTTEIGLAGLYGGVGFGGPDSDFFTGNTLNIKNPKAGGITVGDDLMNFQLLNFYVPGSMTSGGVMLDVGGTADVDGTTIGVAFDGAAPALAVGEKITLIDASAGTLDGTPATSTVTASGYTFGIAVESGKLVATVTAVPFTGTGPDLIIQGGKGADGTAGGVGAKGMDNIQTLAGTAFDSITVISGNGGDSGGGNSGGAGGDATLILTAQTVTVSGNILVKTGDDGDGNTGAYCGEPQLRVYGTLRAPSITAESTNDGGYWVTINTLDVSEDTTITAKGGLSGGNFSFGTANIADGKTLFVNNADGGVLINAIDFTGNGTGRIVIADMSNFSMGSLYFLYNPAFDIPSSNVGTPIASIDVSIGVPEYSHYSDRARAYSASGLPAGISIAPATGVISGTPTAACAAGTATITVTDTSQSAGTSFTKSITISYGAISAGGTAPTSDSGSGSGGSSYTPSTATTPSNAPADVSQSQAADVAKKAAEATKASGAAFATVRIKNVGNITLAALQAMANAAGMPVKFQADTMTDDGKAVDVRITLDLCHVGMVRKNCFVFRKGYLDGEPFPRN